MSIHRYSNLLNCWTRALSGTRPWLSGLWFTVRGSMTDHQAPSTARGELAERSLKLWISCRAYYMSTASPTQQMNDKQELGGRLLITRGLTGDELRVRTEGHIPEPYKLQLLQYSRGSSANSTRPFCTSSVVTTAPSSQQGALYTGGHCISCVPSQDLTVYSMYVYSQRLKSSDKSDLEGIQTLSTPSLKHEPTVTAAPPRKNPLRL